MQINTHPFIQNRQIVILISVIALLIIGYIDFIQGDRVLKDVSLKVQEQIRKSDIFSRIGGDEFTLHLPETDSDEAQRLIERIKNELMNLVDQNKWPISFSIGIVSFISTHNSVKEMIDVADTLMYSVKKTSKNRIVVQVVE